MTQILKQLNLNKQTNKQLRLSKSEVTGGRGTGGCDVMLPDVTSYLHSWAQYSITRP